MTCIVAVVHEGRVVMGADSAGVDGSRLSMAVRADRKVFRNGEFVMGFTSSFRMGQLLAHALSPPKPREGADLFAYMVTDFIDAARNCLKLGGYATKQSEQEVGGEFLIGFRGRLFKIQSDYQVGEGTHGFEACGCGDLIALGSLHGSPGADPKERVLLALRAAEAFSAGVRGPFHVESTDAAAIETAPAKRHSK